MRLCAGAACLLLVLVTEVGAAELLGPDPARAPEDVVLIQLEALMRNDEPTPDAGITQTYALAHPLNKRVTGPLPRFRRMIRSPAYRPLIGHGKHEIERVSADEMAVRFKVVIETPSGQTLEYRWEVGRVTEGPDEGAWLTTSVSAPADAGQAI